MKIIAQIVLIINDIDVLYYFFPSGDLFDAWSDREEK
jgi:hypothetical protein